MPGHLHKRAGGYLFTTGMRSLWQTKWKRSLTDVVRPAGVNARLYSWGYNDVTCPPTSMYSAYNVILGSEGLASLPRNRSLDISRTAKSERIEWLKDKWKVIRFG